RATPASARRRGSTDPASSGAVARRPGRQFLSAREASAALARSETSEIVPNRYAARPRAHSCFGQIACRDLAKRSTTTATAPSRCAAVLARVSAARAELLSEDRLAILRPAPALLRLLASALQALHGDGYRSPRQRLPQGRHQLPTRPSTPSEPDPDASPPFRSPRRLNPQIGSGLGAPTGGRWGALVGASGLRAFGICRHDRGSASDRTGPRRCGRPRADLSLHRCP